MEPEEVSGGRVSNAWVTYPLLRDNSWKRLLIRDTVMKRHRFMKKDGLVNAIDNGWTRV